MCYSEFQDILDSIAAMDADVLSVEASRSRMELLSAFIGFKYPNAIGPGVYDIHSPRVPKVGEIEDLLRRAAEVVDPAQIWLNPDCGLKTRGWKEVLPSLTAMVLAATLMRRDLQARAGVFERCSGTTIERDLGCALGRPSPEFRNFVCLRL